ncbi:MAG: hypothetical protein KA885_07490 [Spirochaetes bacterium]|nr:hypothetical protein [Spirochaetota bacterium]
MEKMIIDGEIYDYMLSFCFFCKNFNDKNLKKLTCKAFPQGIPFDILESKNFHTTEYSGDNGIRYEVKDEGV